MSGGVKCPECGNRNLIKDHDSGEIVCSNCGYVIDDRLPDSGPEWRAFDDEQRNKRSRVGAPTTYTMHDKGLSTTIDWKRFSYSTRKMDQTKALQIYNLRKWQRRIRLSDSSERNLAFALTELSKISMSLNTPKHVLETASLIYRKALKKRLIRGRSIQGIVAASIYMACRLCGLARTLDEISRVTMMDKREIARSYRFIVKELSEFIPPVDPIAYVSRFSNQLGIQGRTEEIACEIVKKAVELKLTCGRGPTGVAAAALYLASILTGNRRTQREVAEVANVTEVTVRNRYSDILKNLDIIIWV
ncbi:MAG: transcription initiation factor IIB [Candidatus Bathyarchaeia archaeon]